MAERLFLYRTESVKPCSKDSKNIYKLNESAIKRSITLTVLSEQYNLTLGKDNNESDIIVINLPKTMYDINIIKNINKLLINNKEDNFIIKSIMSPLEYDKYFDFLKFLRYNDIDNFISSVSTYIENVLKNGKHNNKYLYDLMQSSLSNIFINSDKKYRIAIDTQEMINSFKNSEINYDTFLLLLKKAHEYNHSEFVNITGLLLEEAKLDFRIESIDKNYESMSHNIFNNEFCEQLKQMHGIFLSGGSLVSCANSRFNIEDISLWSDIDIWVYPESYDTKIDESKKIGDEIDDLPEESVNKAINGITDTNYYILIKNLETLLKLLVRRFETFGKSKILFSSRKNVINLYCADYKRNIQIILMNDDPTNVISQFDMDYVQAYYSRDSIYCNVQFLLSNIEKTIMKMLESTTETRIIKAFLKGYKFSNEIKNINQLCENKFLEELNLPFDVFPETDEEENGDMINQVMDITNKYYFPTIEEIITFENDQRKYNTMSVSSDTNISHMHNFEIKNRLVYMIHKITGHNNLYVSMDTLLKHMNRSMNLFNVVDFFSSKYENDNQKFRIRVCNIDQFDITKIVPFDMYKIPVSDDYRMITIPFKYSCGSLTNMNDSKTWIKPCFLTEAINLQSYPFPKYCPEFHRSMDDCKLFDLTVWLNEATSEKGILQIFDLVQSLDDMYSDIINNSQNFKLWFEEQGKISKPLKLKNVKYHNRIINITYPNFDDEDDDDHVVATKKEKIEKINKRIKFKLWFSPMDEFSENDNRKLLTKIIYLGKVVTINKLSELHKYIKKDVTLKLTIVLDTMKIKKLEPTAHLFLVITKIDIINDPRTACLNTKDTNDEQSIIY
jgi:hypothetical protein